MMKHDPGWVGLIVFLLIYVLALAYAALLVLRLLGVE